VFGIAFVGLKNPSSLQFIHYNPSSGAESFVCTKAYMWSLNLSGVSLTTYVRDLKPSGLHLLPSLVAVDPLK
jgi:hypothetical protein